MNVEFVTDHQFKGFDYKKRLINTIKKETGGVVETRGPMPGTRSSSGYLLFNSYLSNVVVSGYLNEHNAVAVPIRAFSDDCRKGGRRP